MNRYEKDGRMPAEIQAPVGDRTVITELSEEFSLPDYQPEMKRLLRVRATVLPSDQYVGAGNVECSGRIDYNRTSHHQEMNPLKVLYKDM